MEGVALFFIIAVLVGVAILSIAHRGSRSHDLIEQWASANGYRVMNAESRPFSRGPFFWTTSKGQTVYYVTFADAAGQYRSAYVRCGSWMGGLWSDKVDVRWED